MTALFLSRASLRRDAPAAALARLLVPDDWQPFAPVLAKGDRLRFSLRANAVIARPQARDERGKRHDVVMDVLHALPSGERAASWLDAVAEAGRAWLARQGRRAGSVRWA
jgi:CRISPR system Cascade subunit CasE